MSRVVLLALQCPASAGPWLNSGISLVLIDNQGNICGLPEDGLTTQFLPSALPACRGEVHAYGMDPLNEQGGGEWRRIELVQEGPGWCWAPSHSFNIAFSPTTDVFTVFPSQTCLREMCIWGLCSTWHLCLRELSHGVGMRQDHASCPGGSWCGHR